MAPGAATKLAHDLALLLADVDPLSKTRRPSLYRLFGIRVSGDREDDGKTARGNDPHKVMIEIRARLARLNVAVSELERRLG